MSVALNINLNKINIIIKKHEKPKHKANKTKYQYV